MSAVRYFAALLTVVFAMLIYLHRCEGFARCVDISGAETNITYNCSCDRREIAGGSLELNCTRFNNSFPVLADEGDRNRTKSVSIERSKFELIEMMNYYPNLKHFISRHNKLHKGVAENPFTGLNSLESINFHWTNLTVSTLEKVLCSLPPQELNVTLYTVFLKSKTDLNRKRGGPALTCLRNSNVTILNFAGNNFTIPTIQAILCNTSSRIKSISLGKTFLPTVLIIKKNFFACVLNRSHLTNITLYGLPVTIARANVKRLQLPASLTSLKLYQTSSNFKFDNMFRNLSNLTSLNLGGNFIRQFGAFTNFAIPTLTTLDLSDNLFPTLTPFAKRNRLFCLRELRLLGNRGGLQEIPNGFIKNLKALEVLNLDRNSVGLLQTRAFDSKSLKTLKLGHMKLETMAKPEIFQFAKSSLEAIYFSNLNGKKPRIPKVIEFIDNFCRVAFQNLPNLTTLELAAIGISVVDKSMFDGSEKLRYLDLSDNIIASTSIDLSSLSNLVQLNLNYNLLTTLPEGMFPEHNRQCLSISLSYNSFACSCDIRYLQHLMRNTCSRTSTTPRISLASDYANYECAYPRQEKVYAYDSSADCPATKLGPVFCLAATVSVALCLITLSVAIGYRYRFHMYYCYIYLRTKRREYQLIDDAGEYEYDAFISYNKRDIKWVKKELRPQLEDRYGLKLCIHHRDWLAGVDIVDNIVNSIASSRKTVLVVTNAFAVSNWCQLELTMAQHQLFAEDKDNLVMILMEDLVDDLVTPRLALEMRRRTYLRWEDSPMGQRVFWQKLVRAVKKTPISVKDSL